MPKKNVHPKTYKLSLIYSDGQRFEVESTSEAGEMVISSPWPTKWHPAWNKQQNTAGVRSTTCKFTEKYGEDLFD